MVFPWVSHSMTEGRKPVVANNQMWLYLQLGLQESVAAAQPGDNLSLLKRMRRLSWPVWQHKLKLCCCEYQWRHVLLRDVESANGRAEDNILALCPIWTEGCCRGRLTVTLKGSVLPQCVLVVVGFLHIGHLCSFLPNLPINIYIF